MWFINLYFWSLQYEHRWFGRACPGTGIDAAVIARTTGRCRIAVLRAALGRAGMMATTKSIRAATLKRIGDLVDDTAGVRLHELPPFTVLLVSTTNSLYRVVITESPEVYIQGGYFFPNPTSAYLDGASIGGDYLKVGWIGVGLSMEIRSQGRRITTSRVRIITIEKASNSIEH